MGAKLTYSYIGSSITKGEQHIPQTGAVGNLPFTGDAVAESFEYQVTNQLTLTPYIGVSINRAYFYLGAGPSYSQAKESLNNLVGYAYLGSGEVNISGAPTTFSATDWVFGFSAVAGGNLLHYSFLVFRF
ncbi:MAG: hypothetical protein IPL53_11875 [Ignavibacteria bacterium]|nr:hypothetical protein [Ignavibacteria bacterium]